MSAVFVSYSSTDAAYVERLVRHLETTGFPCWYDCKEPSGIRFDKVIAARIDKCAVVVLVMTPQSRASDWVANEFVYARQKQKPILPLLLSGKPFLDEARLNYEDVSDGELPGPRFTAALVELIGGTARARPSVAGHPAPPLIVTRAGRPYREPTPVWVTVIIAALGIASGTAALMLWGSGGAVWVLLGSGGFTVAGGLGGIVLRSDTVRLAGGLAGYVASGTLLVSLVDRLFVDERPAGWPPPILTVLGILTILNATGGFYGLAEKAMLLDHRPLPHYLRHNRRMPN